MGWPRGHDGRRLYRGGAEVATSVVRVLKLKVFDVWQFGPRVRSVVEFAGIFHLAVVVVVSLAADRLVGAERIVVLAAWFLDATDACQLMLVCVGVDLFEE
jgi:hypothetical protein